MSSLMLRSALALALSGPLWSATAAAACDQPTTPGELARHLSTADAAFSDLDAVAFREALTQARAAVPCLSAPLSAGQIAGYHRAEAFEAFLNRDHAATVQHFRAMLAAAPGYALSELIAPDGHPLRTDFEIAEGLPVEPTRDLPRPVTGVLHIDGRQTDSAPLALPFVLQQVDEEGKVLISTLVEQGSSLSVYEAEEERQASKGSAGAGRRRLGVPLVAAAVVAGATSASLYGVSSARSAEFWDPATPDEELEQLRRQTNSMAYASLGVGVVAVGVGTAAVLTFAW